jgi:HAMP domain-containing protein
MERPPSPPPFSLRLTFEERARLERDASGMPLGAYIRARLFADETAPPLKRRGHFPVKDHAALAQVLGLLGQTRLSNNLNQIAKHLNMGSLDVSPEVEDDLRQAAEEIGRMRESLFKALGLENGP